MTALPAVSRMRWRGGRAVVPLFFTLVSAACGAARAPAPSKPASPPRGPVAQVDGGPDAASTAPGEPVPTVEVLASRGPTDMPSMREVLRSDDATKPNAVAAGASDTCFRAVVAASAPVRAWFEDEHRAVRGLELAGTSGLVPPRGPACARRGETLRLVIEPSTVTTARAVIWRSP